MIMTMLSIIWFLSIDQVLKIDWKSEMEHVVPSRNVLYIKTLGWLCALGGSSRWVMMHPAWPLWYPTSSDTSISFLIITKIKSPGKETNFKSLFQWIFMRRCFTAKLTVCDLYFKYTILTEIIRSGLKLYDLDWKLTLIVGKFTILSERIRS